MGLLALYTSGCVIEYWQGPGVLARSSSNAPTLALLVIVKAEEASLLTILGPIDTGVVVVVVVVVVMVLFTDKYTLYRYLQILLVCLFVYLFVYMYVCLPVFTYEGGQRVRARTRYAV